MKEASVDGFASQVVIKGNVFVNFNSPAIDVHGVGQSVDTPPENIIITANSMDLTVIGEPRDVKIGDEFLIYGHKALPWLIHHNIIDAQCRCILIPLVEKEQYLIRIYTE